MIWTFSHLFRRMEEDAQLRFVAHWMSTVCRWGVGAGVPRRHHRHPHPWLRPCCYFVRVPLLVNFRMTYAAGGRVTQPASMDRMEGVIRRWPQA